MASIGEKIKGTWQRFMQYNPIANNWYAKKRKEILNRSFLESPKYDEIFLTGVKDRKKFLGFEDDAQNKTSNFMYRHFKMGRALGSWRWKGVYLNKETILPMIYGKGRKGIDFGGGAGPITTDSTVVDFLDKDIFGRPVKYRTLDKIDFQADFIFSSHTLEHIQDLEPIFKEFVRILKPGGDLILNLPSYTCIRWNVGVHTHNQFNDHKWTFTLAGTTDESKLPSPLAIDVEIEKYFDVYEKKYTGDNSILILAKAR